MVSKVYRHRNGYIVEEMMDRGVVKEVSFKNINSL